MNRSLILLPLIFPLLLVAQPRIVVTPPELDFGERRSGDVFQHTFVVENKGDKPLFIHRVRSTCGCTVPKFDRQELFPGESTEFTVTVDLRGRSGAQRQNITLNTNDPANPAVAVTIHGTAIPSIDISPRTLNFEMIEPGERPEGRITLKSTTGRPFTIKNIQSNNQRVETRLEMAADGLSAEIVVTPLPQAGEGNFTDVLIIETSEEELSSVRVLVMWQISSGVSVAPAVLSLVRPDPPRPITRFLMVKGTPRLSEPLKVTSAEWPGREMDIRITDAGAFGWRVELHEFTPVAEMNREHFLIHTNAKGFETLRIPVRVLSP